MVNTAGSFTSNMVLEPFPVELITSEYIKFVYNF